MKNVPLKSLPFAISAALCLPMVSTVAFGQKWIAPTPEELSMTSIKEVPGAAAVILDKDESTDDAMHAHSFYYRIKILTDKGKEYANVELPFNSTDGATSMDEIEGRTIHPDGTVIPLTGKPYEKLIEKTGGYKIKAKVFTLPSVEVGSIIEYKYQYRLDDNLFEEPLWDVQADLFTRKAHFRWRPTQHDLVNEKGEIISGRIAWSPILPAGAQLQQTALITGGIQFELTVHDIPPMPAEEDAPPVHSLSYRVWFYYTHYDSVQEYWTSTGKQWSKNADKFIGPSSKVTDYAKSLVAPTDTDDQKARKLYAAVMKMDNTDFTREHTSQEDKAAGLREVKTSEDTLKRERGSSDQLTLLFVAMARSVGLKAYAMGVADRNERLFLDSYMSLRQIDADVAIVNIGGKDVFFDPGERYCEPEHLSWRHAYSGGIRQTDTGTALATTPGEPYKTAHTTRLADLKLDEHGEVEGPVTVSYEGDPALRWRQVALTSDETNLNEELKSSMEKLLPGGMDVKVTGIENLTDFDHPLKVKYAIKGAVGSSTGKRLLVPADIFMANEKPRFSEPKREIAVDLHYARYDQDAVRFKLPDGIAVESAPDAEVDKMSNLGLFDMKSVKTPTSVISYRNLTVGIPIFLPTEYGDLKTFYGKLETKDQETIVLTHAATAPAAVSVVTKPTGN